MDLAGEISLSVEAEDNGKAKVLEREHEDASPMRHVKLLPGAGLPERVGAVPSYEHFRVHLSWDGHDSRDAVRDAGIWNKTQEQVAETGGSAAREVVKALAIGLANKKISQHTGFEL